MHLVPCPDCSRHVKATDVACPFCAGSMPKQAVVASRVVGARAAMLFGASALVVACGGDPVCHDDPCPPGSSSSSSSSGAPAYGAPAPAPADAGNDAAPDSGVNDAAADAADAAPDAKPDATIAAYGGPGP